MRPRRNAAIRTSPLCVAAVAAACGVAPRELGARSRGRAPVADARHLALYLDHVAFGASLSACGRALSRDRASVRHACARIEDRRDDPDFDRAVVALEQALGAQKRLLEALAFSFISHPTGEES